MDVLQHVLGRGVHIFLPVIHVQTSVQAVRNASIAFNNGADGVFLINHQENYRHLLQTYERVREAFPTQWIGLNFQDVALGSVLEIVPKGLQGLWVDNAGIDDEGLSERALLFHKDRKELGWPMRYFGGVAFKGQAWVNNPGRAASFAVPYMDVVTTSGEATGFAPPLNKIKDVWGAMDGHPLAIASGMSVENVEEYMPYTDCFLVATKISLSETELDEKKVSAFAKKLGK